MKPSIRKYTVIYEKGKRNWSAYVPDLPGCVATAKTQEQLANVIRDAMAFHIEGLIEHGEPPTSHGRGASGARRGVATIQSI